jgi:hypothetical protein
LTLDNEADVVAFLESHDKQSKALKDEVLRMCWFMRGGLSYSEAMLLSSQERELIGKIIKDNLESTKKSGMPFF